MKFFWIMCLVTIVGCGVGESEDSQIKVVGGEAISEPGQFGLLALRVSLEERAGICSGSLISQTLVITAAHCLHTPSGSVAYAVFGPDALEPESSQIRKVTAHYRSGSADIAILEIDRPAPSGYLPIPIADGLTAPGALLAGYGRTVANAPKSTGKAFSLRASIPFFETVAPFFYVQSSQGGMCFGDSGGPALVRNEGQWAILGVLSSGSPNCSGFDQYTSVYKVRDWVRTKILETEAYL
ncbi:MAG: trypsin-like serine protease [Pseudobacteriovorax sp.]|nr:trypsin-like serine protease [Pseudobacteriovorax sp.]